MPKACPPVLQEEQTTHGCGRGTDELRVAYFAHASDFAIRYGVRFDLVIEQVRDAERRRPSSRRHSIRYIDDLVHAVACVEGVTVAWSDLIEQHERALLRACREQLETTDAIIFVRRFFAWLRRNGTRSSRSPISLRRYDGTSSLRRWLRERVLDTLQAAPWDTEGPAPFPRPPAPLGPLTLIMPPGSRAVE